MYELTIKKQDSFDQKNHFTFCCIISNVGNCELGQFINVALVSNVKKRKETLKYQTFRISNLHYELFLLHNKWLYFYVSHLNFIKL